MRSEFWHSVWEEGKIGFHAEKTNPFLMKFWPQMGLSAGDPVFVPLCGKSLDMLWLAEQKHPVLGVELSPIAAQDFFTENNLPHEVRPEGSFMTYQGGDIEILAGNYFDMTAGQFRDIKAVYDRAALVALPETMRQDYARQMSELLPAEAKVLLLTFEYDQSIVTGPPHSISYTEVRRLFESKFLIERLDSRDLIEKAPRFKSAGLDSFVQSIYLLDKLDY